MVESTDAERHAGGLIEGSRPDATDASRRHRESERAATDASSRLTCAHMTPPFRWCGSCGTDYVDQGQEYYERRYQTRVLSTLSLRAHALGYTLIKTPDQAPAPSDA